MRQCEGNSCEAPCVPEVAEPQLPGPFSCACVRSLGVCICAIVWVRQDNNKTVWHCPCIAAAQQAQPKHVAHPPADTHMQTKPSQPNLLSPGVAEAIQLDYGPSLGSHVTFELWAHVYRWHANRVNCDAALIRPRKGFQLQLAAPCTALLYLTAVLLESGLWILYTLICSLQATRNGSDSSTARSSPASHSE